MDQRQEQIVYIQSSDENADRIEPRLAKGVCGLNPSRRQQAWMLSGSTRLSTCAVLSVRMSRLGSSHG